MVALKDALVDFNPWWTDKFSVEFKEREVYARLRKFLPLPQIIALTGLRRVGKTTLLLKIAADAIESGWNPRDIVYFSFDEFKETEVRALVKEYEALTAKDVRKGKFLFLLDEVQKLDDWENQVKTFYDVFGKNVKIIVSGSESLFIRKKSKETLAGRIFEFEVERLSFNEFLGFKNLKKTDFEPVGLHERELRRLFDEFVLSCGFPELVGVKEKEVTKEYLKGIMEKIIYKDIPRLFKVRDPAVLESLLNVFAEEPGQLVELSSLAKDLGLSRQTVSSYLSYLEDSFLVKKLYNFARSRRKVERKLRKYYPAFVSPDLLFKQDDLSKSKVFEWLVVSQLNAEFFWRDAYKNEVDVVLLEDGAPAPFEVKHGEADSGKLGGLKAFMKKFKVSQGVVVSRGEEKIVRLDGKTVSIIPAFKFFLRRNSSVSRRQNAASSAHQ